MQSAASSVVALSAPPGNRQLPRPDFQEIRRWIYGAPPQRNTNLTRMRHMLHHPAPRGSMSLLLANGSISSNTKGEGEIHGLFQTFSTHLS